jgi:glycosyltransferase involved in cell wall biosynthesis
MKVLYDITVLGAGKYNPRARTGIFRVVENIAYGIKKTEECDLFFCASSSIRGLSNVIDYLKDSPNLSEIPVSYQNKNIELMQKIDILYDAFHSNISIPPKLSELPLRILRKALIPFRNRVSSQPVAIASNTLKQAQIYHSPFEKFPLEVKKSRHLKKLLTVHDLIPILYPHFFDFNENSIVKDAISSLDSESWVLSVSHATKSDLCNYSKSIDSDKVIVTHLAASDSFYPFDDQQKSQEICQKYNIPDAPYILSLSTLEPRKNIDHTIRCFLKLVQQEKLSDLNLVLVGTKGWNYDKIFAEISNNSHLEGRIIVTGYVADEDLAPLYSGALAFVYPSFYEGFGLPPLEAMQCGVPVITSNTSSLPEVVGDAGIMLDPKDEDGLCHSLLNIYNDENLRASMAEQSLKQAKKFSWEKCTQETINAYKIALNA